ncbi:MAG TPA: cell division protein ZapA [Desulfovibrio sp.]|jgi:cell division protein ZapA|nr:cell division protein ZapA [Desulfovibrio sp.]
MPRYTLALVGLEVTFKTDADQGRIDAARELIENRFADLVRTGGNISKEKLLTFLALGLADDYLESEAKLRRLEDRISGMLEKVPGP